MLKIKRVYDDPGPSDGFRVLIDRLWPRGLSKDNAKVALWLKEIAPSMELRKSFGHDPAKWEEFEAKYERELDRKQELVSQIKDLEQKYKVVTLVYGSKDQQHNDAVVLLARLRKTKGKRCASRG
ncbi:MAG: DUF488 family protein [Elusimicrobia bacterium]|nr:DUF488 family protein [Elusimicrobiota bacterium]MDE2424835.1 DUF488 family protein [Elusimicrobiota bacterium]